MDRIRRFIEYASTPEQQRLWTIGGSFLPTLKGLYDDGEVLERVPPVARRPTKPP